MYASFSEVYDELMADVNYTAWADYYGQLMAAYGIREGRVCECACGTGSLTLPLYKRGFHMTGVDLSQEMLFLASQKARSEGIAIPFAQSCLMGLNHCLHYHSCGHLTDAHQEQLY